MFRNVLSTCKANIYIKNNSYVIRKEVLNERTVLDKRSHLFPDYRRASIPDTVLQLLLLPAVNEWHWYYSLCRAREGRLS